MELVFVDSQLKVIPAGSPKEQRFAIDLCYKGFFAGEPLPFLDKHFFVSAQPWAQNMTLSEARSYLRSLEKLNPDVVFCLLTHGQIDYLNYWGTKVGFEIKNSWTSGVCTDWHGRIDGRYSIKNGILYCDDGQNLTDVHVLFGFTPGEEKPINRTL